MSFPLPEAEALFGRMLDGEIPDPEIATLLVTLADRGETASEVAGAVLAMRDRMKRITAPKGSIDVCGTGGDGQHSLNISTAVALVVAACGVPVAKHGNRAASSLAGGADTLEALGLNLARASELAQQTLPEAEVRQGTEDAPEAPMPDIDADVLAELVRDILRDELQGALGLRMTRNIRKLVRAEVARILSTKDLA